MNIAIYVPPVSKNPSSNFIVETFFPLFEHFPDHHFILITEAGNEFRPVASFEHVTIKAQPKNRILRSFWIERTLTRLLRAIKADIFISTDNFCLLRTTLPQCILMPSRRILKQAYAKKAELLIVTSGLAKNELINRWQIPDDKVVILYPPPGRKYSTPHAESSESIKQKYSEGKEYFLCSSSFHKQENFIGLLKSFSHFKKRQQSNFKLLIIGTQDFPVGKNIESYKYRHDIVIINPDSVEKKAAITTAAYALVLPFNTDEDITNALGGMQSGVPVITTRDSSISEIAGDAVLCSGNEIKDIGEKMMQLYKDELLRSQLIEKGKKLVEHFTVEKSARRFWQSIMKALN